MKLLLFEYKISLRLAKKALKDADHIHTLDDQLKTDRSIIKKMIKDLEYVIEWIEHGREPGKRRGADRVNVYLSDPILLDQLDFTQGVGFGEISDDDKVRIDKALFNLSDRERDVYVLHHAKMMSFEDISDLLGISKSSVQTNMKRAENKIRKEIMS